MIILLVQKCDYKPMVMLCCIGKIYINKNPFDKL